MNELILVQLEDLNSIWDLASHDMSILKYFFKDEINIENKLSKDFLKKSNDFAVINFQLKKKYMVLCIVVG